MNKIIFIGAGDYAASVFDSMTDYQLVGFIDDEATGEHMGYPILGNSLEQIVNPKDYYYFITIGDSEARQAWYNKVKEMNLKIPNIIDSSAIISKRAKLGEGNFVGKGAIICNDTEIGNDNMIQTGAVIDHHCSVGNHVRILARAVVTGNVILEDGVLIGSNACCTSDQTIGRYAKLGAGAVLFGDMEPYSTYVGIPAKRVR